MSTCEMRGSDELFVFVSKWDIGSSGAHTKATDCAGTGFSGVAQTAAGKYTVTFTRGMPVGKLLDFRVTHWPAIDAQGFDCGPRKSGFTAETAAAAATMKYEAWDNDTAAQTELTSGDQVSITAVFAKTK